MKLIGIRLISAEPIVRKTLKTNAWYPFGRYEEPKEFEAYTTPAFDSEIEDLYQIDPHLPKVSVQCIVGMNGSGKSSLLDILLRIITNFAFVTLKSSADNSGRDLKFAYGLTADLYFEVEGQVCCIHNGRNPKEMSITLGLQEGDMGWECHNGEELMQDSTLSRRLLEHFFYTISTNYSTYAFNENDYKRDLPKEVGKKSYAKVNGKWLGGIFHKNDGYQAPIVMTPYRRNFNIDVNRETKLANQRITTLSLMLFSQKEDGEWEWAPDHCKHSLGKLLIRDQVPCELVFEFQDGYYEELTNKTAKMLKLDAGDKNKTVENILRMVEYHWKKVSGNASEGLNENDRRTAFRYLAYKTIKIGLYSSAFKGIFDFNKTKRTFSKTSIIEMDVDGQYLQYNIPGIYSDAERLIKAILEKPSHITLKIRQCLNFILRAGADGIKYTAKRGVISIDDFLGDKRYDTYDDMFLALPPAFYKLDIWYRPRQTKEVGAVETKRQEGMPSQDQFSLGQMSSGQKQWLNCLSYVCYHIKNIESVNEADGRIPYHHINLIFDEAELYYHPEYQRTFVRRLLEALADCHIVREDNRKVIESINILIATHSPFILSDILTQNTLYLRNGKSERVDIQTFGANYYDLLRNSFFIEHIAVGDIASKRIGEWVEERKQSDNANRYLPFIGDRMVQNYFKHLDERRMKDV